MKIRHILFIGFTLVLLMAIGAGVYGVLNINVIQRDIQLQREKRVDGARHIGHDGSNP